MKSMVMPVIRIVRSTSLRMGEWFDNMDLLVDPLDDHVMILGLDFLILSKEAPFIHKSHLVFLDEARTPSTPLKTKRKLKRMPRIFVIKLVEGVNQITNDSCNVTRQQEFINIVASVSSLRQEGKQLTTIKTLVKVSIRKVGRLKNP
jgi:hypothetical protein